MKTGETKLYSKVVVPVDPSPYTVDQVFYPSRDGTRVSMFIVHRKDMKKDGRSRALLWGYGGFQDLRDLALRRRRSIPGWNAAASTPSPTSAAARVRRGVAQARDAAGEAERVRRPRRRPPSTSSRRDTPAPTGWRCTAAPTAACSPAPPSSSAPTSSRRWCAPCPSSTWCDTTSPAPEGPGSRSTGRRRIPSSSRPSSPTRPTTTSSPERSTPPLLLLSADHDDRVDPMHARKFAATMQAAGGPSPVLLRIERNSGHGGADLLRAEVEKGADRYAFLLAHTAHDCDSATAAARADSRRRWSSRRTSNSTPPPASPVPSRPLEGRPSGQAAFFSEMGERGFVGLRGVRDRWQRGGVAAGAGG